MEKEPIIVKRDNRKTLIETIKMLGYVTEAIGKFDITYDLEEGTEEFSNILGLMTEDKMLRAPEMKEAEAKSGQEYYLMSIIKYLNLDSEEEIHNAIYDDMILDYAEDDELADRKKAVLGKFVMKPKKKAA